MLGVCFVCAKNERLLRRARERKVGHWLPRGLESTSDIALGQICMKCFREQEDHSFGRRVSCTARAHLKTTKFRSVVARRNPYHSLSNSRICGTDVNLAFSQYYLTPTTEIYYDSY